MQQPLRSQERIKNLEVYNMAKINDITMTSGIGFVPTAAVRNFAGNFDVWAAQHKADPDDFVVQERQPGLQCTVSVESDFPNPEDLDSAKGPLVAVTLVKYRHTTPAAIEGLARLLNIPAKNITAAGLKDRTARSAQMVVVEGVELEHVRRHCFPDENVLREHGFFIKDARRCTKKLGKGHLEGNHFQIKLIVAGKTREQLEEYLAPRLEFLMRDHKGKRVPRVPNFFGRQRLGRRQNLLGVGVDLIENGLEAGIKRFICEVVENNDHPKANELRRQLAAKWAEAERIAEEKGQSVAEQFYCFLDMKKLLETIGFRGKPLYKTANMFIEYKLVNKILSTKCIERAVRELKDDLSLSVGAFQGYWFNQLLGDVNDEGAKISVKSLDTDKDGEPTIPLYFPGDERSVAFYRQWCPQAVPDQLDRKTKEIFLSNFNGRPGPRRPAFIFVNDLSFEVHDEVVSFCFSLRSGAYATTFLSYLFQLDTDGLEVEDK
jgi:TruD family tRNA pseudouridine synthase